MDRTRRWHRRRRPPCALLVLMLALASLLHPLVLGLDLSNQGLTNITVSDSNATSSAATFTLYRGDGNVQPITAAALGLETELVLRNNALGTIPAALFRALRSAKRVDLSHNPKLLKLESNSFVDLPQLVEITCVNTSLLELPALLVSNCPQLERVTFNASFIHTVNPNAIANAPMLQQIHLSQNNMTQLFPNSFANLSALDTLDLSYNNLSDVPGELFRVAKAWRALDFTRNNITRVPPMIQQAVVPGYISFERNLFFEIKSGDFANAADIAELRLGHNGIFTINSSPFDGMTSLRKLDLSDNVISVIRPDAFKGLDALKELLLGDNYLKRLKLEHLPPQLERLELQSNLMDLMPDLSTRTEVLEAPNLRVLNLSHNVIWGLETNTQLKPYSGLVELDLSWNRIENFTASVLTSIEKTVVSLNMDFNQIASVPSTVFLDMLSNSRTTVSLQANPGIGVNPNVLGWQVCPNGSVYNQTVVHSAARPDSQLFGCIQCPIGYFHDVAAGKCVQCVGRAFADRDGATACQYCPYSSDLDTARQKCLSFACNGFCWLTVVMGFGIPLAVFGSKLVLYTISTTLAKHQRLNGAEHEQMTTWRMEQMLRQLGAAAPSANTHPAAMTAADGDGDDPSTAHHHYGYHNSHAATLGPCRIYDLPKETQETVLETLQEHFQLRKQKLRAGTASIGRFTPNDPTDSAGLSDSNVNANAGDFEADEWDDVEWSTFHMHRILSRNYHGEVFLGDYCGAQVVVKRLMTLRFEVRELADAISDVELMLTLRHPHITTLLGTMWTEREHLCLISEYVRGGDLHTLLDLESMHHTTGGMMPLLASHVGASYLEGLDSYSGDIDSFHTQLLLASGGENGASTTATTAIPTWWATKLQMARDVCSALAHAHDHGVTHGDLRSRNVLVTEHFGCKLNDFRHHARSDKYASTTLRLQSDLTDDEDDDGSDDFDNGSDVDVLDPEGVHLMDAVAADGPPSTAATTRTARTTTSRKGDAFALPPQRHYMLPLLAPEMLHHAPRHLGSDMYSCGVVLIELWFYRHVSAVSVTPSLQDEALGGTSDALLDPTKLSAMESVSDGTGNATELSASVSFFSLDRAKVHTAMVQTFLRKLRACAHVADSDETIDRSFGTATTSSCASLSFASSAMMTEKLLTVIEECLHFDPKKRPTAKMLVKLFQQMLDDASPRG